MKLDQQTVDQIAAIAVDEGLELLATEVVGSGPKAVLRLIVDGPDGVTLDQCSAVSRQASALLDVDDPDQPRLHPRGELARTRPEALLRG